MSRHAGAARGLALQDDVIGVAAEGRDVVADPAQQLCNVDVNVNANVKYK